VFGADGPDRGGDAVVGDPVDLAVTRGVHGEPVAHVCVFIEPAVAGVVDQQVVGCGHLFSVSAQGREDVGAGGVEHKLYLKAVLVFQDTGHRLCIASGGLKGGEVRVAVIADDQGMVRPEVGGGGGALGIDRLYRDDCGRSGC